MLLQFPLLLRWRDDTETPTTAHIMQPPKRGNTDDGQGVTLMAQVRPHQQHRVSGWVMEPKNNECTIGAGTGR